MNGVDALIAPLSYVVAVTTVLSGALYLKDWIQSVTVWESSDAAEKVEASTVPADIDQDEASATRH